MTVIEVPDIPPFLRRGSKEHKALLKRVEKLAAEGKVKTLAARKDEDEELHRLAAELGFKRHHYQVNWFRDPRWVAERMAEKVARDEAAAAKAETRAEALKRAKAEKALAGSGNKAGRTSTRSSRARADLPSGRIVWAGGANPKKEGTDAHARWAKLISFDKRSVESYLFDGGNPTTLANALKQGRCKVLSDADVERESAAAQVDTKRSGGKKSAGAGGAAVADGGADRKAGARGGKPAGKRSVKRKK